MSKYSIETQLEALALSNVVNPGGQRIDDDGTIRAGLPGCETNCVLVAIAAAAMMIDGTEKSAMPSPSQLLISGNRHTISYISSFNSLNLASDQTQIECPHFEVNHDDTYELIRDKIDKITSTFDSNQFLILAHSANEVHWFNLLPNGNIVDAQIGLIGDELLEGQIAASGKRQFNEFFIYPIDKELTGQQLISNAESLHQTMAMNVFVWRLRDSLDVEINTSKIYDEVVDPYVSEQLGLGKSNPYVLYNDKTADYINKIFEEIQNKGIKEEVIIEHTKELLKQRETDLTSSHQYWLGQARYRDINSPEDQPSIIETLRDRCPIINKALLALEHEHDISNSFSR